MEVDYSTDGGTTWTQIPAAQYSAYALDSSVESIGAATWIAGTPTLTYTLPSSAAGKANVQLRWYYKSINGYYWALDNIVVNGLKNPSWSPLTALYADAGLTTAYTGVHDSIVYAAPVSATVYTLSDTTGGCAASTHTTVHVNAIPAVLPITGSAGVCAGSNIVLSDATGAGTWSSSNVAIATVTSGVVSGIMAGTDTISYFKANTCGTTTVYKIITVNPLPVVPAITGSAILCTGRSITFSDTATLGAWSASNGNATINSAGVVTGVRTGSDTITYSETINGCTTSVNIIDTVEVTPVVPAITGTTLICTISPTTILSNTAASGVWSASNSNATVYSTGYVLASSVGMDTISYTKTNGGCVTTASVVVSIYATPVVPAITGSTKVCAGSAITLGDTAAHGVWSVTNSRATVNTAGIVSGARRGTDTVKYTKTVSGCVTAVSTIITVDSLAIVPAITGSTALCTSSPVTFSDTATSGVWSANNGNATVSTAGLVTGISAGADTIKYAKTNGCGTNTVSSAITIYSTVPAVSSMTGTTTLCAGASVTMSDTTTHGTWSTVTGNAVVNPIGVVTGVSGGTDTVKYSKTNACGTTSASLALTIKPFPAIAAINGLTNVCAGSTITLSDTTAAGSWSSTNTAIATVGSTGIVKGIRAGTAGIKYAVTGGGCTATSVQYVTVSATPSVSVSGSLCPGNIVTINSTPSADSIVWQYGGSTVKTNAAGRQKNGITVAGKYGVYGSADSVISFPNGIYVDAGGNVYVADYAYNRVQKWAPGADTSIIVAGQSDGTAGSAANQLNSPTDVFVDDSGNIYVSDAGNNRVQKWAPGATSGITAVDGKLTGEEIDSLYTVDIKLDSGKIHYWLDSNAYLWGPWGVTVDAGGNIYVTDEENSRVQKWAPGATSGITVAGQHDGEFGGHNDSVLTYPQFVRVDGRGNVYVSDVYDNRVQKWAPGATSGTTVAGQSNGYYAANGAATNQLIGPTGLFVDIKGNVFVSDFYNLRVMEWAPGADSGIMVAGKGVIYSGGYPSAITGPPASLLYDPRGVFVDANGNLYVADQGNQRVQEFKDTIVNTDTPTVSGSYSAIVTSYAGCKVTADFTIGPPIVPAISGPSNVCVGSTATLTDTATGGAWSSSNTAVATISGTGAVSGVSAGTTTISYIVTNPCGTTTQTASFTVVSPASPISGITALCTGATTTLSDSVAGGTWTSSNTAVATISSAGVVSALKAGTTNITYKVTGGCGTTGKTMSMTVSRPPSALSGTTALCKSATVTLSDSVSGGTWTSSNTAVATVASGKVSGISAGTATITYTLTNTCGTISKSAAVTVSSPASAISGTTAICRGSSTTLSDSVGGGSWTSSNSAVATVSSSGNVTGLSTGTATITYKVVNTCGTTAKTVMVTVSRPASILSGTTAVCTSGTTILSDSVTGGTWSSNNTAVATVNSSGKVSGLSAGTTTIYYTLTNACGVSIDSAAVAVNSAATALSGTTTICAGTITTLSEGVAGGTWTSSNTAVALVSSTGTVSGVSAGTSTITYKVSNACGTSSKTATVTVGGIASIIGGTTTICTGGTTTLSDSVAGGNWSSSNTAVATVNTTGKVSGVTAGTAIIYYRISNICGATSDSVLVTVNSPVPAIKGTTTICAGGVTTLSDSVGGGNWTSSNTAAATISSAGVVSGMSAGTTTITYTLTNACGTATKTAIVTVNSPASMISGTTTICTGATATLSDSAAGGNWTSSNTAIANINSAGAVSGVSAGTTTIYYAVTNACGTGVDSAIVTVNSPASVISGTTAICIGGTTVLSDGVAGGAWSSSNTAVATTDSTGTVSGLNSGTTTITYKITNSCGTTSRTANVTVNRTASVIGGTSTICIGTTTTLSDSTPGGTWSCSNAAATISNAGVVSGVSADTATITYTLTNSCGTSVANVAITVMQIIAGTITGNTTVCKGNTDTLTDSVTGGTWGTTNLAVAAVSPASGGIGIVTASTVGTATIVYTVKNACGTASTTFPITVNIPPAGTITGGTAVCAGSTDTLTDTISGGIWTSTNTFFATISRAGVVTAINGGGSTQIIYSLKTCAAASTSFKVKVNPLPYAGVIVGSTKVCEGSNDTLIDATPGGAWSSTNTGLATVSGGVVTCLSAGRDTIKYTQTNVCGTAVTQLAITIEAPPNAGTITGNTIVNVGSIDTLADIAGGGIWSSNVTAIATISSTGITRGVSAGTDTIKYTVRNSCGSAVAVLALTVNSGTGREANDGSGSTAVKIATADATTDNNLKVSAIPNPTHENITVSFDAGISGQTNIRLMNLSGVTVFSKDLGVVQSGSVVIPLGNLASGTYLIELTSGERKGVERVVKE